jgi:hypothetical protein
VGFGHEGGTALLPIRDETDLLATGMKTVEHREVTFTRNAERMGDALGHKALNKKMAGKLLCHALIVPPE